MKDYNTEELNTDNNNQIMEDDELDKEEYEEYMEIVKKLEEAEVNLKNNGKLYNHDEFLEYVNKAFD